MLPFSNPNMASNTHQTESYQAENSIELLEHAFVPSWTPNNIGSSEDPFGSRRTLLDEPSILPRSRNGSQVAIHRRPLIMKSYHSLSSSISPKAANVPSEQFPWTFSSTHHVPWFSLGAVLVAVFSTISCAVLLRVSDGTPVERWRISVSVCLAVLSALANASLRFALSDGVRIAWWMRALRGGAIKDLHRQWQHGTAFGAAMTAGRHFNLVALASIAVTLVVIDGPLLQRASSFAYTGMSNETVTVNATVATQLPFGYTGFEIFSGSGGVHFSQRLLTPDFLQVFQDYNTRQTIKATSLTGCSGTCSGVLQAAGLRADCSETEDQVTWMGLVSNSSDFKITKGALFNVSFEWTSEQSLNTVTTSADILPVPDQIPDPAEPYIEMRITYSPSILKSNYTDSPLKPGDSYLLAGSNLVQRTCKLYSTTNLYSILIKNDTANTNGQKVTANGITLQGPSKPINGSEQSLRKSIYRAAGEENLTEAFVLSYIYMRGKVTAHNYYTNLYSTLGGLATVATNLFRSNMVFNGLTATPENPKALVQDIALSGSLSGLFLRPDSPAFLPAPDNVGWLGFTFNDPTLYILSALDEIMFRTAISASKNDTLYMVTIGNRTGPMANATYGPGNSGLQMFPESQLVSMQQTRTIALYQSNYKFLAMALAFMFFATSAVAPVFHGFWLLGRQTSLSPFETGKAMGATILKDGLSNASAKQMMREIGDVRVRYGEVYDTDGRRRLAFSNSEEVRGPEKEQVYD